VNNFQAPKGKKYMGTKNSSMFLVFGLQAGRPSEKTTNPVT
jgi:hypothetical protein